MLPDRTGIVSFVTELRRRKVIRVAVAYIIVALGVVEVANNFFPPLGLPDWTIRLVVTLVVLGLPLALVLAWAFDITPRGIERTDPVTTGVHRPVRTVPRTLTDSPVRPAGSIAALPFANLSGDPAQDYLGDGLTEELIVALSRVPGLRVAARTSCFAVKQAALDVRQIGDRLGVRHVVEGSVRLLDRRLRLSVQLVDVATGYTAWSETFDRAVDDIFAVQREVARTIVQRVAPQQPAVAGAGPDAALVVRGAASDGTAAPFEIAHGAENVEAFTLYLRGRYHWNRRTEADLRRAIGLFEEATEADPACAPAYAGLADAYALLLDYGGVAPAQGLGPARQAVERALALDPDLAEAYTSLALVREFEWRWADAEAAFRRSIGIRPGYAIAHQRFGLHCAWRGRAEEALREAKLAESLDPLSVAVVTSAGFVLYYARRPEAAKAQLDRALEMDPHFATASAACGLVRLQLGETAGAVECLRQAVEDSGRSTSTLSLLACALAQAGESAGARELSDELEQRARSAWVSSYYLALPRLALGEADAALDRLEAAGAERAPQMAYLQAEPVLDPLRGSARFGSLLGHVFPAAD